MRYSGQMCTTVPIFSHIVLLGSHCAHMWAIPDFVPVQSIGDPKTAGVR